MKKILNFIFLLCALLPLQAEYKQDNINIISCAEKLSIEILKTMEYLHTCKSYWEQQKNNPYSYFFRKNPTKWFWGENQDDELNDHIKYLYQELEKNAYHLGKLHILLQTIQTTSVSDQLSILYQELKDAMTLCLKGIPSCNKRNPTDIETYYKHTCAQLGIHNLPSHFTRHWIQYSALSLGIMIGYVYWYKNHATLSRFIAQTHSSAQSFWLENVKEPMHKIVDIFYKTNIEKPVISDAKMKSQEYLIKNMIIEYFHDRQAEKGYMVRYFENRSTPIYKYTDQEIIEIADQALITGIVPKDILDDYAYETVNPVKSLISPAGKILSIFMLKVHWVELDGYKIVKEIETIKKANLINVELLAFLPALVVSYLGYKAFMKSFNYYNPWNSNRAEIKLSLDKLEQHINQYNNSHAVLDEQAHGYIAYWIYHIKSLSNYISIDYITRFNELLDIINNCNQTINQKLVIIHQIIRMIHN